MPKSSRRGPLSTPQLWLRRYHKAWRDNQDAAALAPLAAQLLSDPELRKVWPDGLWSLAAREADVALADRAVALGHVPGQDALAHFFLGRHRKDATGLTVVQGHLACPALPVAVAAQELAFWERMQPLVSPLDAWLAWLEYDTSYGDAMWAHASPGPLMGAVPSEELNLEANGHDWLHEAWGRKDVSGPALALALLERGVDPFYEAPHGSWSLAGAIVEAEQRGDWEARLSDDPGWRIVRDAVRAIALSQALPVSDIPSRKPRL